MTFSCNEMYLSDRPQRSSRGFVMFILTGLTAVGSQSPAVSSILAQDGEAAPRTRPMAMGQGDENGDEEKEDSLSGRLWEMGEF